MPSSSPQKASSRGPTPVDGVGHDKGDDEDASAPGEGRPDVATDRLLGEQVTDRVDDGRHRLVLGERPYRAGHRRGGHEGRADERQEDQRVGKGARAVHALRGKAGDDRDPGQRQREQDEDAGDREPGQYPRARAEPHEERDADDEYQRDDVGQQRGQYMRPQHARPGDRHGLESLEDAALHVGEEPECGVGDARRDGDEQDAGSMYFTYETDPVLMAPPNT